MTEQQEREQQVALNAKRNRKFQQDFRGDLLKARQDTKEEEEIPQESIQKRRLNILKAGAIKEANARTGGAVGASVGGAVGSIIPFIGTGIGAFLGRFVGKKLGITGFILIALLAIAFQAILFILVVKGYCDSLGYIGQAADYLTVGICQNFK
ncbi:MAG: hypothetical protein O3A36_00340 [bacterium]|nr:hypothetical protein [bacterium]